MSKTIKVRTSLRENVAEIRMLLRHPMEVGRRSENGDPIAPHFITELVCEHNGEIVLNAHWGAGIAKNPYVAFFVDDVQAGDRLSIRWRDNQGGKDIFETNI